MHDPSLQVPQVWICGCGRMGFSVFCVLPFLTFRRTCFLAWGGIGSLWRPPSSDIMGGQLVFVNLDIERINNLIIDHQVGARENVLARECNGKLNILDRHLQSRFERCNRQRSTPQRLRGSKDAARHVRCCSPPHLNLTQEPSIIVLQKIGECCWGTALDKFKYFLFACRPLCAVKI